MPHAQHPIWPILRTTIILSALIIVLYINASHFDITEIRAIITMFLALIGAEGATSFLAKRQNLIPYIFPYILHQIL